MSPPHLSATSAAHRTSASRSARADLRAWLEMSTSVDTSASAACTRAVAAAYKLVVAMLRNAKRYAAPSQKVVAGPSAASWSAPCPGVAERPTAAVSMSERSGLTSQSASAGVAKRRISRQLTTGGEAAASSASAAAAALASVSVRGDGGDDDMRWHGAGGRRRRGGCGRRGRGPMGA